MSKYYPLQIFLRDLNVPIWVGTFEEVEDILGFKLPASARKYPAWWSNSSGGEHSQTSAWQDIGWKTQDLDIANERVVFADVGFRTRLEPHLSMSEIGPLTIAEAKTGLSLKFGVPKDDIEILIKG